MTTQTDTQIIGTGELDYLRRSLAQMLQGALRENERTEPHSRVLPLYKSGDIIGTVRRIAELEAA